MIESPLRLAFQATLPMAQEHQFPATQVESPLPGGIAEVVRFFFNVPQWLQIGGFFAAVIVGVLILWLLWRRRARIRDWVVSRPRAIQVSLAGAVALVALGVISFGTLSWDYMQHDNDFCTGCHVMATPFRRFEKSAHVELSCHDCHRQSIFASAKQLYLWVAERPVEITEHSPVPNEICAECHIRGQPEEIRDRIIATAGHRVHLASVDSTLRDVLCVTCHGVEVHEFAPVTSTCAQVGCHDDSDIQLGRMAGQTSFHCVSCHAFTAPAPEDAPVELAAERMLPGQAQCLACHLMEERALGLVPPGEVHDGVCGLCHNPHAHTTPAAAFETCASAECHAEPEALTPMHVGLTPGVLEDCSACHKAHDWVVSGRSCLTCHSDILEDDTPFPSTASNVLPLKPDSLIAFVERALPRRAVSRAQSGVVPAHPRVSVGMSTIREADVGAAVAAVQDARPFRHSEHRDVACEACHSMSGAHGALTISMPEACSSCHHSAQAGATCDACHTQAQLAGPLPQRLETRLSVWGETREWTLPFDHRQHTDVECNVCHGTTPSMTVASRCEDCHDEHHGAAVDCSACHGEPSAAAHPLAIHTSGCGGSGCHVDDSYTTMEWSRNFCLACHHDQREHEMGKNCADCHPVPTRRGR